MSISSATGASTASSLHGKNTSKVLPRPGSLFASIQLSCCRTTPYTAANFGFDSKGLIPDAEVRAWLEQSLKAEQNIANLWLKARMMERAGNKAEAIRIGEMAIAAASADQADFFTREVGAIR